MKKVKKRIFFSLNFFLLAKKIIEKRNGCIWVDGGEGKINGRKEGRSTKLLTLFISYPGRHLRGDFPQHLREGANETLGVWYWSEASSRRRPLQDARLARRERMACSSCGWKDESRSWRRLPIQKKLLFVFFFFLITYKIFFSILFTEIRFDLM